MIETKICPDCAGMGFIRQEVPITHPDFGKLTPCPNEIHQQDKQAILLAHSGLKDHERWLLDDLVHVEDVTREMVQLMKGFMENPRGWIYLWGGFGTGKTVSLQAAVYETIKIGKPAYYTTLADLLGVVKAVFNPPTAKRTADEDAWRAWDTVEARFERMRDIYMLALDEFDSERVNETGFAREFYGRLMDGRYRGAEETVTLFAANKPPTAHTGWIADRFEDGRFIVFEHTGKSVRPQNRWWDEV